MRRRCLCISRQADTGHPSAVVVLPLRSQCGVFLTPSVHSLPIPGVDVGTRKSTRSQRMAPILHAGWSLTREKAEQRTPTSLSDEGRLRRPRRRGSGRVGCPIARFRVLPCKRCCGLLRGHLRARCGWSLVRRGLRHASARLAPAAWGGPTCDGVLAACRRARHADAGTRARSGGQGRQRSGRTGRRRGPGAIARGPWRWVWDGRH